MSIQRPGDVEKLEPLQSVAALGTLVKHTHRHPHICLIGRRAYLRLVWPDYISLFWVAGLTVALYYSPMYYLGNNMISIWPSLLTGTISHPALDSDIPHGLPYPGVETPLSSWMCGVVVNAVPLVIVAVFQLKFRSLWDLHAGLMGVLKTTLVTTFVTTILKICIGGLRPNFLALCKPNMDVLNSQGSWMLQSYAHALQFNTTVCQGSQHDINKALQGFPSGHTSSAFAAATFLTLYLNGKLKTFADYASDFWVIIITIIPMILASLVAGAQYTSHQHHPHEVFAGMVIGSTLAFLVYRSAYASVFDFRYNHIPLPPFGARSQFSYTLGVARIDQGLMADSDRLVFWNWWKPTDMRYRDEADELSWLRNTRGGRAGRYEMVLRAKGRDRSREVRSEI